MMAIASNQGGCAQFGVGVEDLRPGMWFDAGMVEEWAKITEVSPYRNGNAQYIAAIDRNGNQFDRVYPYGYVAQVRYKSIEDAYAEMVFAMELTGIEAAFFCPDMAGEKLHIAFPDGTGGEASGFYRGLRGKYRKPEPGMLLAISTWAGLRPDLMVGDRPEDQAAAKAAGFTFEWAADYFGGSDNAGK